jgi:hypothetical protein
MPNQIEEQPHHCSTVKANGPQANNQKGIHSLRVSFIVENEMLNSTKARICTHY